LNTELDHELREPANCKIFSDSFITDFLKKYKIETCKHVKNLEFLKDENNVIYVKIIED